MIFKKKALVILLVLFSLLIWSAKGFCLKIAVVDLQKVLRESLPGKEAIAKLKRQFKSLKEKLDKERKKIKKMEKELQKQKFMLSQEAKIDKETEYKKMLQNYQIMYQSYQYKMRLEEKRLREPIVDLILSAVDEYRKEKNLDLILDKAIGVVSSSDKIDITQEIIKRVNEKWRKKGKK